ncbi:MAG: GNAT family N-acetyltransferase [Bryobacteraceae bacterium]
MMRISEMPAGADLEAVRAILQTDRHWAVYALADLAPEYSTFAEWHVATGDGQALLLVYRAFRTPVLFAQGPPAALAGLLAEVRHYPEFYLSVRADFLPRVKNAGYRIPEEKLMWRMRVDPASFRPVSNAAVRLTRADYDELARLYADGAPTGETPQFFDPAMLTHGIYFGVREGLEIVAAAGTHVLAPGEGVAAIGNVYTRRDRRNRGLAQQATSAVTAELLGRTLPVIVLNVAEHNVAARRAYERLGFRTHCEYREGLAMR